MSIVGTENVQDKPQLILANNHSKETDPPICDSYFFEIYIYPKIQF